MFSNIVCVSVIGSIYWPVSRLYIAGSMRADGQSYDNTIKIIHGSPVGGLGGGSGGTILLFIEALSLVQGSYLSVAGGDGVPLGGGGGGGGRLHFHWSNIGVGNEYVPLATINGTIYSRYANYHESRNYLFLLISFQYAIFYD